MPVANNFDGPIIIDQDSGVYLGFGRADGAVDSFGVRIYPVNGNPNGILIAPPGSLALSSLGEIYQNTDGASTWIGGPLSVLGLTIPVPISQGGTGSTNASDARVALGAGSAALTPSALPVPISQGGTEATTAADARIALGAGSAALTPSALPVPIAEGGTGATTAADARTALGAGSAALTPTSLPVPIAEGGTAANTALGARTSLNVPSVAEAAANWNALAIAGTYLPIYGDYLVGSFSLGSGGAAPTVKVFVGGIKLPAFAGVGPIEEGFFEIHINHDIKAGTVPTFHVHWSHLQVAPVGDVKWNLEITAAKGYGAGGFTATSTLSVVQAAAARVAGSPPHQITPDTSMVFPAPFAALLEPDMKVIGRLYRDPGDAADTFGFDAFFLGIDMHYEVGQVGSTERNRPFTSIGF